MTAELLIEEFETLTDAPNGIPKLRELILQLAVQGKLVPQDLKDEPASVLLEKIGKEKERLIAEKKIKKSDPLPAIKAEEYPYELPKGWEWCRLGDVGTTNIGLTYSPKDIGKTGTPVLRSNNIQKGKIDLHNLVRVNKTINESLILQEGDLLICARNGSKALVGKTAQIKELPERMAFGAFMAIFRSRCSDFAEVYLNSPEFRKSLEGVSTTTINQITQANLKNSLLPLPSLAEQRRIVAKVDQLMALCDELERKQNEKNVLRVAFNDSALTHLIEAKEPKQFALHWNRIKDNFDMLYDTPETVGKLRQTILQLAVQGKLVPQDPNDEPASVLLEKIRKEKERLIAEKKIKKSDPLPTIKAEEYPYELPKGWEWCRIDDIALTLSTGPFGTMLHKSDYVHDGVPLINPMNIVDGKIFPSIQKSVSNATKKRLSSYILEEGDVVIARRGEMGRCAAVTEKESGWLCGTGSFFIRLGNGIDREYFTKYFGSPSAMQYLMESSIGSTMNNLNHRIVGNMLCPLSPLAEQSRIVSKFEELMALCDEMEKQLAAAEEVNGALLESVVWRVGKG